MKFGAKKGLVMLCAAALLLPVANVHAKRSIEKIGYINVQQIVAKSDIGKEAREKLAKLKGTKNAQLKEIAAEIENLSDQIKKERQKKEINQEKMKGLIESIQETNKKYQRFVADAKEAIAKLDRELVAEILKKANPVLKRIVDKEKYTIIIKDAGSLAYIDPSKDITDEVVKGLNKIK